MKTAQTNKLFYWLSPVIGLIVQVPMCYIAMWYEAKLNPEIVLGEMKFAASIAMVIAGCVIVSTYVFMLLTQQFKSRSKILLISGGLFYLAIMLCLINVSSAGRDVLVGILYNALVVVYLIPIYWAAYLYLWKIRDESGVF